MIDLKKPEQIAIMKTGGKMLAETLMTVMDAIKPGVSELELDVLAEKLITEKGGEPGFKRVKGYHHTICMATNDVVVHGIPTNYQFKPGDLVCVDCGVYYKGLNTDMAETILIPGDTNEEEKKKKEIFLAVGKRALAAGIAQAVIGNHVGHISKAIQDIVEKEAGYSIVRTLVGHGVGKELHEEPEIPGYLVGKIEKTPRLVEGMTIAVEIIYNMGGKEVVYAGIDDWTISTKDGSLSAVFERTIAVTQNGPVLLTQ